MNTVASIAAARSPRDLVLLTIPRAHPSARKDLEKGWYASVRSHAYLGEALRLVDALEFVDKLRGDVYPPLVRQIAADAWHDASALGILADACQDLGCTHGERACRLLMTIGA